MGVMDRRTRWTAAAVAGVAAAACLGGWWLLRSDSDSDPGAAEDPAPAATISAPPVEPVPDLCDAAAPGPFIPERVSVEGVVDDAAVIGVPRDSRGVTGVLPVDNKVDVAWDLGGIRPGSARGNVLLNTHTWPDGSALGNALLDELRKGDRIVVRGDDALLCYDVSKRVEVLADHGYEPYYEENGPHQLAIVVCSGTRSSDGEWSHRTLWFARVAA